MLAGALATGCPEKKATDGERGKPHTPEIKKAEKHFRVSAEPCVFDNNPDFFKKFSGGEFSKEEKQKRTEVASNGITIFHDIGLDFYIVKKGDTIKKIRIKLSGMPKYGYLEFQYFIF